ncbi:uncharacterized protein YdgA (DUF945 family) [Natronospira proteinivora]|uniref:Uncharacterized protein YdgA (DUF945 family) n=1 Tax=Natronospira proteinivora TaxID=1807133 RepID=A0ABT1GA67_9GAMM|nr:DUF945 family protein [Natronospira proteinivora]MCP1728205.1 uncharacterized protein YdgA (DUF945 family) [Natronospira proteinivora]
MKSNMKKWLGGLLVVLLLLVLVAPAGVGMMAEGRYKQIWQDALDPEPAMDAEVVSFDRGWFSSNSEVALTFSDPMLVEMLTEFGWAEADEDGRATLLLQERIHHGPVPFTAPAPFTQRWKPGFATVDSRPDENLPFIAEHGIEISSTTHLGLMGGLSTQVKVLPFDFQVDLDGGDHLRVVSDDAITLDARANRQLDRVQARLRGGELNMSDEAGVHVSFSTPWVDVNQRRGPADLWLGGVELRLASMEIRSPQGEPARMEGLLWSSLTDERGDLVGQEHEIYLESLSVEGFEAGPAEVTYDIFNIHPQSAADLQEAFANMPQFDPENPQAMDDMVLDRIREPVLSLMEHQLGLRMEGLDVHLPGGSIKGEGVVQFRDLSRSELGELFDQEAFPLLLNGEGQLSASRNLVRRTIAMSMMGGLPDGEMEEDMAELMDMQIDAAIDEGMLSETEDGDLEIRVRMEDGVFSVNDNEMFRF